MADTIKNTLNVKLQASFDDGDTRIISLDNPRSGLTEADITALNTLATAVLIGDKTGATFTGFIAAKYVEVNEVKLDLS